jgi:diguanylate cyclase (GGDEF)-like protein/PAS domain S-box-containing protein
MSSRSIRNGITGDTLLAEVPLTLSGAATLAASLHGSLQLSEILRRCRRFLENHFRMGRLSLVQHRANEATATLYSLDDGGNTPLIGPRVIAIQLSRLRQSIVEPGMRLVPLASASDQDKIERKYLLRPETGLAVYAPLLLSGKLKGILVLDLPRRTHLSQAQQALLSYVADQLALAIENSDHHYLECRRSRQLEMVSEISKRAVQVENLDAFLQETAQLIRASFDYHAVQVWTFAGANNSLTLRAASHKSPGEEGSETRVPWMVRECRRLDNTLCNNAVPPGENAAVESEFPSSQLAVPIRLRSKLLGVLYLESGRLDAFPVEDLGTMEGVASLIAGAYENLWALEHAQQSNEYMQAILESAKDLAILSTDTQGVVITSSVGSEPIFHLSSKQILGTSVLTLFTDTQFRQELAAYLNSPDSFILERKRLRQNRNKQKSYLDVTMQRVYDPEKLPIGFLCIVQDVTGNVHLEERLESLSITDELTGLYNRRRFFTAISNELERSRRFRRKLSLCFIDLDGFKKFNDLNGHRIGDRALKEAAELVMASVRSGIDTCYRYGGDEFTIIMPETTQANARIVAERIREQLKHHYQGEISASIGVAESTPLTDVEKLLEKADRAMYKAKSLGGNRTAVSD